MIIGLGIGGGSGWKQGVSQLVGRRVSTEGSDREAEVGGPVWSRRVFMLVSACKCIHM